MRETHRRRRHVVRGLADVHVIVRIHVLVRAKAATKDLVRAVGDDLVRDHVHRDAGTGVKGIERELLYVGTGEDLVARRDDRVASLRVQATRLAVRDRFRLLDLHQRADEGGERMETADRIVVDAALRLRAPQRPCRDFDLAEGVLFAARRRAVRL